MSRQILAVSSSNHRQRSGGNLADGYAIPGSGLLLTTWQTPTVGFRKQERQVRTRSTGGCLRSIAQRTRSSACLYWIGIIFVMTAVVYDLRSLINIRLLCRYISKFYDVACSQTPLEQALFLFCSQLFDWLLLVCTADVCFHCHRQLYLQNQLQQTSKTVVLFCEVWNSHTNTPF